MLGNRPLTQVLRGLLITLVTTMLALPVILAVYIWGAYHKEPPIFPQADLMRRLNPDYLLGNRDALNRLIKPLGKTEVPCPPAGPGTGVLLVMGQSNSANHADTLMHTRFPKQAVNYHDGRCYVAESPLLGTTGDGGEFATPLADELIERGVYKHVVIMSLGVGGTPIARWRGGGDLNAMMLNNVMPYTERYQVSEVVWHQGESDFVDSTSAEQYRQSFKSLQTSLWQAGVKAPIFLAVATKCGPTPRWAQDNPVAQAQRSLPDGQTIVLGADTDALLTKDDRRMDQCHLNERGLRKTAKAYAEAIEGFRTKALATKPAE